MYLLECALTEINGISWAKVFVRSWIYISIIYLINLMHQFPSIKASESDILKDKDDYFLIDSFQ